VRRRQQRPGQRCGVAVLGGLPAVPGVFALHPHPRRAVLARPVHQTRGPHQYPITSRILAQEHGRPWNAALSACAKLAPPQLPFTEAQLEAARSKLLPDVRCMRAHGFPGWPNPVINPNDISFLPPAGVNVRDPSPQLQAAEQACRWPAP
jgi:hypothetical protein